MKLILASAGFYTPGIAQKCAELVGKPINSINIAVINEAYAAEPGDHGWVLDDLNNIKKYFKGRMELVNLLALDLKKVRERLALADVIFVVGGHTDYLMAVFKKTGFDTLLPKVLKNKVYVGSSAGSMVMGERVSTKAYARVYGETEDYGVQRYLGLVPFAIKPHLDSPLFPNNRKRILLDVTKDYKGVVYGLTDDAAIVIEGNKIYPIGSEPLEIKEGQVVGRTD